MPDRFFGNDTELVAAFSAEEMTGPEYSSPGIALKLTCKSCEAQWAVPLGEMGEVPRGHRNALLAHSKAHLNKGLQMRRLR